MSVAWDVFITYKYNFHFPTNGLCSSIKDGVYEYLQFARNLTVHYVRTHLLRYRFWPSKAAVGEIFIVFPMTIRSKSIFQLPL